MRRVFSFGAAALALFTAAPALAEVIARSDNGFVVRNSVEVAGAPADAWRALIVPSGWWLSDHTFSGDSLNLTLDPVAGGCFCEKLPPPKGAPATQRAGGVQHMRVIYAESARALRLSGGLGPLQSEALTGTLTITLKATDNGTRILWEYVVGGYMRYKVDEIAPAVDRVLAEQLASLAKKLGPVVVSAPPPQPPTTPEGQGDAAPVAADTDHQAATSAFDAAMDKKQASKD